MKKEDLFWKIGFIIVIVLVIGFIYIQGNQKAELKAEQEARQEAELQALFESLCREYNTVAYSYENHYDGVEYINEGECASLTQADFQNPGTILDNLLLFCRLRNYQIRAYDNLFGVKPLIEFEQKDCNLVVQSYNGIMSR